MRRPGREQRPVVARALFAIVQAGQGQLRRNHRRHVQRVEAHAVDQPVGQRVGGHAGLGFGDVRVSLVQRRALAPAGVGHAQHAAQQLFDGGG